MIVIIIITAVIAPGPASRGVPIGTAPIPPLLVAMKLSSLHVCSVK